MPRQAAQRAVLAVGAAVLVAIGIRLAMRPSTDLLNHQEFGRRFVAGTFLYEGGLNYPYLPAWAAAHAPLAPVPAAFVSVLLLPLGVAALVWLVRSLDRLSRDDLPLSSHAAFWVTAATLALTSRFVIRDLLDGGANLILTALVWASLVAWLDRRSWVGAARLAAAVALKLTALVFLPVLAARRASGAWLRTAACTAVLTVAPAAWMGVDRFGDHLGYWWMRVPQGWLSADPRVGVLGAEPLGNVALRAAVGRWLLDPDAPVDTQAQAATAARIATAALLVALLAWTAWRRNTVPKAVTWAAAAVAALLVSPITWRAHLVAIVPGCYLLIRRWVSHGRLDAAGKVGLGAIAIPAIALARGVAGDAISQASDRYSVTTLALLVLLGALAAWPTRR